MYEVFYTSIVQYLPNWYSFSVAQVPVGFGIVDWNCQTLQRKRHLIHINPINNDDDGGGHDDADEEEQEEEEEEQEQEKNEEDV